MNRYKDIGIIKTEEGRRYRRTVRYPIIQKKSTDTYIVGRVGDRLDNLAYKYYKDAQLWWIIARANNIGQGSFAVPTGKQIRIPSDFVSIVKEYNNINS